jgi:hypothetical protein
MNLIATPLLLSTPVRSSPFQSTPPHKNNLDPNFVKNLHNSILGITFALLLSLGINSLPAFIYSEL